MVARCQSGLPAVGEVLEPFAYPHVVAGWMRGSHSGPLMPCHMEASQLARFDGPPRVVGMGFQLADGALIGPRDMLGNSSFERARRQALEIADSCAGRDRSSPRGARPRRWSTRRCRR
jgi:fructose 1,6-bisphosphate aldolase/phosphatase